MLQRWTQISASSAALVAILMGLGRSWEFWSIVRRASVAYLVMFGIVGIFLLLVRIALESEPPPPPRPQRSDPERRGINGTDAAL